MLALTFSNLVPTPPALLGVVSAVTIAVCVPFGIPRVEALALGTLLNGVMVLPTVVLGGWAAGARLLRLFEPGSRGSLRQLFGLAGDRWKSRRVMGLPDPAWIEVADDAARTPL